MKKINLLYVLPLLFACACGGGKKDEINSTDTFKNISSNTAQINSREIILQKIKAFELEASKPGQVNADARLAQKLIGAYNEYFSGYPQDTASKRYAFLAASVATNTYSNSQAVVLIDKLLYSYPQHEQKLNLLFMEAMIYDDRLNDDAKAKEVYERIIKDYPNTPAAAQCQDAMKLLGKSDADLIKEFNKKNKGDV